MKKTKTPGTTPSHSPSPALKQPKASGSPAPTTAATSSDLPQQTSILFDVSKKETHTPQVGFKKLYRKLRASHKIQL